MTPAASREDVLRYRRFFEASAYGMLLATVGGAFLDANPEACRALRRTRGEIVGAGLDEIFDSSDSRLEHALECWATAEKFEGDLRLVRRDGTHFAAEVSCAVHRDGTRDDEVGIIFREVLERGGNEVRRPVEHFEEHAKLRAVQLRAAMEETQDAEELLRLSLEHTQAVVSNAPIILFAFDHKGVFTLAQGRGLEGLGLRPEEIVGESIYDVCNAGSDILAHARRALGGEEFTSLDEVKGMLFEVRWLPERDRDGAVMRVVGVATDVTEKARTADDLRRAEYKYRSIFDNAVDGIFQSTPDRRLLTANAKMARIFGYESPEELMAYVSDGVHHLWAEPDRRDEFATLMRERGVVSGFEFEACRKDGGSVWVSVSARVIRDADGEALVYEGMVEDITERKRTEEKLRHSLNTLLSLREAGQLLGSTLESEEIGSRLLAIMQRVSGLTAVVIDKEDDSGRLRLWRAVGLENLPSKARFAPEATDAREAVLKTGAHRLYGLLGSEEENLVGLCMPLQVRDRIIGLLEAFGPESLAEADTIGMLSSLANQAASALENARLYTELAEREHQLSSLVSKLLLAQEEERRRVAYEVHDGLTQVAVSAYQYLQAFSGHNDPPQGREYLDKATDLMRQTIGESRRVIANLRPTALDDFGLAVAIRLRIEALREEGWEIDYEDLSGAERLPSEMEIVLYRVAQEALTNVGKHAGTTRVQVRLERDGSLARLRVRDRGRGFDPANLPDVGPGERVGISGMRERVALIGGELEIHSEKGVGTTLTARVPIPESG